ncbi:MAG: phosphate signaling complex protein PhoU [Dehalococcoidia bacterium]|jgi:phosphate transport system protein|nr:phosphate signaling complex protein PhoU [Dehalococcoidia bacterium]MDP7240234.1 phosphate signaling complex protein PhoU [Dehalococcoidia bacterium]
MTTRTTLERHLSEIQSDMLVMGSMVGKAITRSVEGLKQRDIVAARAVIKDDLAVNKKRFDIEEKCVRLLATQQPMAGDLRTLVAVLSMIIDLERIGDHAEGIAKITLMLGDEPLLKPLIDIPRMAQRAGDMLDQSLEAFVNRNQHLARQVIHLDDEVDGLYDQVFRELVSYMVEDPRNITRATRLLWVAHNLERIADRVTNICERVVFLVTGKMEELDTSKY